jgi:dynein heavy chain 1, cytosolic
MDLERIRESLERIVTALKKKTYPATRLPGLVEALSRDVHDQLVRVLGTMQLMALPYSPFAAAVASTDMVLDLWTALVDTVVKTDRRQQPKSPAARLHQALKVRLDALKTFRQQHDQLRATIAKVLRPAAAPATAAGSEGGSAIVAAADGSGADPVEDVDQAYAMVERIDVLDLSVEGAQAWEVAEQTYTERVARVENAIIAQLRDALAGARNASEMFRVLGQFNTLFVRPKVRGAVQEYQTSLIKKVDEDLMMLYRKFEAGYEDSEAAGMSTVRDLPSISGKLVWAAQIERQLTTYMNRVEAILGKGWENYQTAQKLNETARNFRAKLSREQVQCHADTPHGRTPSCSYAVHGASGRDDRWCGPGWMISSAATSRWMATSWWCGRAGFRGSAWCWRSTLTTN